MIELSGIEIILLTTAALLTSSLAAVIGQGGGLMLFALLALYFDAPLLIAFHAVVQLFSNASRAVFAMPHINWRLILPIILGTLIGAALVTPFVAQFNWHWVEALMGAYILYLIWGGRFFVAFKLPKPMFSIGLIQGSLGMILGATGPLGNALLFAKGLKKDAIIASNAVIMSVSHASKIVLFTLLNVSLWPNLPLLALLSTSAILGSYLGNKIRHHLSEKVFRILFEFIITILALRMIAAVVFKA